MRGIEHLEQITNQNNPYWYNVPKKVQYPSAQEGLVFDVVVIGGGITGITTAYLLKNAGLKVAVVEAYNIGHGTSGHSTGHFTTITDTYFSKLINAFNEDSAKLVTESLRDAVKLVESLINQFNIECDYRRVPAYHYTEKDDEVKELKNEFENALLAGQDPVFYNELETSFPLKAAIGYPGQAHFHAIKFIYKLAEVINGNGSYVFENSRVFEVDDSDPLIIKTEKGNLAAKHVVYATHTPLNIHITQLEMKVGRSYVIGAYLKDQQIEDALFWDNEDPYHYFNLMNTPDGPLVMIGGGDHLQGMEVKESTNLKNLLVWANARFNIDSIPYVWSGQEYFSPDGLPYIGLSPFSSSRYIATGFAGNGLSFGVAAARIITDLIVSGKSEYEKIYSPSRLKLAGIPDIIELNLHVAIHIIKDRIDDSFVETLEGIKPGEGRIVKINSDKVAVYNDELGIVHRLIPVCPHAKCFVRWNNYERTWDCPCHGSRFYPTGEVLEGPAVKPLPEYKEKNTEE